MTIHTSSELAEVATSVLFPNDSDLRRTDHATQGYSSTILAGPDHSGWPARVQLTVRDGQALVKLQLLDSSKHQLECPLENLSREVLNNFYRMVRRTRTETDINEEIVMNATS